MNEDTVILHDPAGDDDVDSVKITDFKDIVESDRDIRKPRVELDPASPMQAEDSMNSDTSAIHSSGSKKIEIGALSLDAEKAKQQESVPAIAN